MSGRHGERDIYVNSTEVPPIIAFDSQAVVCSNVFVGIACKQYAPLSVKNLCNLGDGNGKDEGNLREIPFELNQQEGLRC